MHSHPPPPRRLPLGLALLVFTLLASLRLDAADQTQMPQLTDSSGQTVNISRPFSRIISLYPAHTENLCSLAAQDLLIGIGSDDDFPAAIAAKPRFSYRDDPERFLAARPDLILVRPMLERAYPELFHKLRQAGVVVVSLQPNTMDELFAYWRNLGQLVGKGGKAEEMIETFTSRLDRVRAQVEKIPPTARPRVFFAAIHAKMKTFAPESIAVYVLTQAGGTNLASDAEQVRDTNIAAYGKERLLSRGEEIDIFLAQQGRMNPVDLDIIRNEPGFQAIRAVREGRIHLIAEALVSRPTLRLLDGIEQLHQLFFFPQTVGSSQP